MTLSWQISIIEEMIRENPEATVGDYFKVMARMGPRQRKLIGPLKRLIWADRYNPGFRRWPPAMIYTCKSYRCTPEEAMMWWQMDKKFEALENMRLPRKHFGKKEKANSKISSMKFRPILFSTPMVKALLDGRKTQTRRLAGLERLNLEPDKWEQVTPDVYNMGYESDGNSYVDFQTKGGGAYMACPKFRGEVGHVFWVREEHYRYGQWKKNGLTKTGRQMWRFYPDSQFKEIRYFNNPPATIEKNSHRSTGWYKRLARFMPKSACRIFLKIEDIRVERLQDISEADAIAEEVCPHEGYGVTRKECEKSSNWLDYMEGARCGAFVMYNQQQADLLAARNKNNDDGIEIARLLAELKKAKSGQAHGWVKVSERFPEDYASVALRRIGTKNMLDNSLIDEADDEWFVYQGDRIYYDEMEWLEILPADAPNNKWETRCLDAERNLTALIEEALQKSKEADAYRAALEDEAKWAGPCVQRTRIEVVLAKYPSPTSNKDNG